MFILEKSCGCSEEYGWEESKIAVGGQVRTTSISPFKQCWGPVGMGMEKNRMGRDLRVVIGI